MEAEKTTRDDSLPARLARAQAVMCHAVLDSRNPHFNSRYASLASVIDAVRAPLAAEGLAWIQRVSCEGTRVSVESILLDQAGAVLSGGTITLTAQQPSPQAIGSALTYARRYSLSTMVGIAAEDDDDANEATGPACAGAPGASPPPHPPPPLRPALESDPPPTPRPQAASAARSDARHVAAAPPVPAPAVRTITEPQRRRLWAIFSSWLDAAGITDGAIREALMRARIHAVRGVETTEGTTIEEYAALLGDKAKNGPHSVELARQWLLQAPDPMPNEAEPPNEAGSPF